MASPTSEMSEPIAMTMDVSASKTEPGNFAHLFYFACFLLLLLLLFSVFHTRPSCDCFLVIFAEAEPKADSADLDDWEAMASDEERGTTTSD